MQKTIVKIKNDSVQVNKTIIGILINQILSINQILFISQIFSNYIHETNKHDKQNTTQHHILVTFNHKILHIHKVINQFKCKMKSHYHFIYNNMK